MKIDDRPHIIDGYLYRPGISSYTGKPSSYPVKSYTPGQPTAGVHRKEKTPEKRGVEKKYTPLPPEQPQSSAGGGASGAPGGGPPGKGPPGGGNGGGDSDKDDDDDEEKDDENGEDKKEEKSEDEYKKLNLTPGQVPLKIGDKIYFVQPAIVEHDLTASGGSVSPPRFTIAGEGGGLPPPGPSGTTLGPTGPKGDKGDKGYKDDKGGRGPRGEKVIKVIKEILMYKELLVCKLELEVLQ